MLGRNLLAEKKGRMINTWPCASRATLQKIASAARTTGGGELRFDLRFHCQHARVKFGRRKWLTATTGAAGDRALSYSRGLVEFRSGRILIKNEAVSQLSIEFA
jgi:hypothetical protein